MDSEQKWKSMAQRNTHNISGFGYICGYSVTDIKPYDLFHFENTVLKALHHSTGSADHVHIKRYHPLVKR